MLTGNDKLDWYKTALDAFNKLDKSIFDNAGLKQNRMTFEDLLSFKVTEEMTATEYDALAIFEFNHPWPEERLLFIDLEEYALSDEVTLEGLQQRISEIIDVPYNNIKKQ